MSGWLRCAACGQAFRDPARLQRHVEVEHDRSRSGAPTPLPSRSGSPGRCYLCGLVFADAEALARHDRWAHPEVVPAEAELTAMVPQR